MSLVVNEWQSANLAVTAIGSRLSFQWRKDGTDITGATNKTFNIPFTHLNDAGSYAVVVSNSAGSVTSTPPAVLTVDPTFVGTVVEWGNNDTDQTTVPISAQSGVTAVAAGHYHTVALKNDGTVVAWGDDSWGQTDVPVAAQSGVTAIAAGRWHTVALKKDGSVVAWGDDDSGQTTVPIAASSGVTAIATGLYHTVALKNDGSVVAWGSDTWGETDVPVAAQTGVMAIAAGGFCPNDVIAACGSHTVALKNDGTVVAWGANNRRQIDVPVAAQSGVTAIAAGGNHTVALKKDGSVVAWGDNSCGVIDVPVAAQREVTAIATGWYHTVALKNDGTVVAWGDNNCGLLNGTQTDHRAIVDPVSLGGQVLIGVTAIAAGGHRTVALIGGVPLLPYLNIRPSGNELILSWPTNAVGFTLQSTLNLTPPVTWIDSAQSPAVSGNRFTLTTTASDRAQFYRLKKP